jgi:hypothetical protein
MKDMAVEVSPYANDGWQVLITFLRIWESARPILLLTAKITIRGIAKKTAGGLLAESKRIIEQKGDGRSDP